MRRIIYRLLIPGIMPVIVFRIATLPVGVWECVAFPASAPSHSDILMDGVPHVEIDCIAVKGLGGRMRGDQDALWWVASSIILAIPVVALLILA